MATATLAGRPFRLDPQSMRWTFETKARAFKTIGGKVVQVIGTQMSDLFISGSFGVGGWEEQAKFLDDMKKLGDLQVSNPDAEPHRFLYPAKSLDFLVYLKAYSSNGGPAVTLDVGTFAPTWELTLFIVQDNTGLHHIATDIFLARLAQNTFGWKQTKYNGPMSFDEVMSTTGGLNPLDYLKAKFGASASANTGQGGGG